MICLRENVSYFDPNNLVSQAAAGDSWLQIKHLLSENKNVVLIYLYSFLDSEITDLHQFPLFQL